MSTIRLCQSVLLPLVVHLILAVHSCEAHAYGARRGHSSRYDPANSSSERTSAQESRPLAGFQQQQHQQQEPSITEQALSLGALNERLRGIFALPDRVDINWINVTAAQQDTPSKIVEAAADDVCRERRLGKTYCVHVPSYLEKTQVHRVSKAELDKFRELFVEDVIAPNDVEMRMRGEDPEDIELCRSRSKVIYPRQGLTRSGEWKFLYQTAEARQGVLEETCENENKPCEFSDSFPPAYVSRCKQYQSYRLMVAVEDGVLSRREFIVGGACKCVLRARP